MKAILIIDMQNDFSDYGSIPIKGSIKLANDINDFLYKIDRKKYKIIFSKDWHPTKHISFERWLNHCISYTYGAKLIEPLDLFKYDFLIKKGTKKNYDNFSCFYNGNKKSKLNKLLNKYNIKDVYVAGVSADFCVKETIIDLKQNNFNPIILEDLILPIKKGFVLSIEGFQKIQSKDI